MAFRPNITVATVIEWQNRFLLVEEQDHDRRVFNQPAGHLEAGENLIEAAQREVMEETGLHVKNIRYYKSQPWAIASDILAGFFCEVDGSTDIVMDREELKEAFWAEKKDIILQPDDFSLTNEMMRIFKES